MSTYTTVPSDELGTETDTFIACPEDCSFRMLILRWISASLFGALIAAAPK